MTYVFECRSCKHEFEIIASVAEYEANRTPSCPRCSRRQTRRVFTPVLVMSAGGQAPHAGREPGGGDAPGGCCGGGACGCRH